MFKLNVGLTLGAENHSRRQYVIANGTWMKAKSNEFLSRGHEALNYRVMSTLKQKICLWCFHCLLFLQTNLSCYDAEYWLFNHHTHLIGCAFINFICVCNTIPATCSIFSNCLSGSCQKLTSATNCK